MPLTSEEYQVVKEWLEKNPITTDCPMCLNKANWETAELVGLPVKRDDAYSISEDGSFSVTNVPMVQLRCTSCGYVAHFSAKTLGVR